MCFPIGVGMKESTTNDYKVIETKKESTNEKSLEGTWSKTPIHPAREIVASVNSEAIFADGFDDAIMGYDSNGIAVYDYNKCCHILMDTSDMDESEANEYMQFNVVGAYVGDFTPIFIHKLD